MANITSYLIFWIVMFVILGAFWYVVDRRFGQGVYRFWYRLTHEKPLPENVRRGFVYNRRTRHKAFMATILSTIQSVLVLVNMENFNPLVELILWIVEVPVTLLGRGNISRRWGGGLLALYGAYLGVRLLTDQGVGA